MWEALENGIGLDIVTGLQANGSALFDALARLVDVLGGDLGFLLILPVIYWSVSRHFGRQLLFVLLVALFTEDGFGLPSGHVTLAVVVWGYIAYQVRRWWAWLLLALYALFVGWSRMYAGVHYPQDVVGGIIIGGLLLAFCVAFVRPAARWWSHAPLAQRVAFILVAGIACVLLLYRDDTGLSAAGIIFGAGMGMIVEEGSLGFSAGGTRQQRIIRAVFGLVVAAAIFFGLSLAFESLTPEGVWRVVRYALVSFALIFLYPWLTAAIGLTTRTAGQLSRA
jgi:hypothetical protein